MNAIKRDFMRECEDDRRRFKLYYSHMHRWPVMVVGLNPGGDPRTTKWQKLLRRRGEHDTFDRQNPFYRRLRRWLCDALPHWSVKHLRLIPQTNINFYRSKNKASQPNFARNVRRCRPFFLRILTIVRPRIIVCLGPGTAKRVARALNSALPLRPRNVKWNTKSITLHRWRAWLPGPRADKVLLVTVPHPAARLDGRLERLVGQLLRQQLADVRPRATG